MSEKQSSEGRKIKRFIEAVSLAVTFLACSLTIIYVIIHGGHCIFLNILLGLVALASSIIFLFFTVALCKTKLSDWYDQIFESPWLSPFKQRLSAIFVGLLWLAIFIGFIAAAAQIYNETSGGWRLPVSILITSWPLYVLIAMVKTTNWRKVIAAFRRRK